MKNFIATFICFLILNSISFSSKDTTFTCTAVHKDFVILWNDSLAIVKYLSSGSIDTIFADYNDQDIAGDSLYYTIIDYQMLSIVGPFVSYEYNYQSTEGAYPAYGTQYLTYNIESKEEFSLNIIFSDEEIFITLMNNEEIKEYLHGYKPKDLNDFINNLNGDCEISFYDMLKHFTFVSIGKDKVLVEFGLSQGCEIMQGHFTTFLITLSIPNNYSDIFEIASNEKTYKNNLFMNRYE